MYTAIVDHVAAVSDFEEFFQAEYRGLMKGLCLLTGDRSEAEELAQETMARVYERWDRVRGMDSPGGYVYRIALNLNRQRIRHLAVRTQRLLGFRKPDLWQPPDSSPEISDAIGRLSLGQRQAFLLVEWVGMSAEEAGRILGIAPGSVRARIHRARTILRDQLSEGGGN